jgi:GTP 3',8-cyclase
MATLVYSASSTSTKKHLWDYNIATMSKKIINIADVSQRNATSVAPTILENPTGTLLDQRSRPLQDLRISLTDRCNFRCVYCMPKEVFDKDHAFLPRSSLLTFEEILRLTKIAVAHGVTKIRLTGGEPLLRKHIEVLIEQLAKIKTLDGDDLDLTLTTNGALLAKKAQALKDAGLSRVTVSLDALNDATFKRMNDVDFPVSDVLEGLEVAHKAGLSSIKINMVVKAGLNDQEIVPMARYFKDTPFILRYIEYMDVGASNGWKMDEVIPSAEVVKRISAVMPMEQLPPRNISDTAERWRYKDGPGEIGLISSVTKAFCHSCVRARISTEGVLYNCLFASSGYDLRSLLREGKSDQEISTAIAHLWRARNDNYSEIRSAHTDGIVPGFKKVEMSYIGG